MRKAIITGKEISISEKEVIEIMGKEEYDFQIHEAENAKLSWNQDDIEIFF